jgi:general stress protein 26
MNMTAHTQRIKAELKSAGLGPLGQNNSESRHLSELIHQDEHIKGVLYGKCSGGMAMLIATDKRIIFFDKKPLFSTIDQLTYDVVSGFNVIKQGISSGIVLHTRVGDYALRYVNSNSVKIFKRYIESHILEKPTIFNQGSPTAPQDATFKEPGISEDATAFLHANELATLSSVDRTGNVNGAVVYYYAPTDNKVYVLTKIDTQKARNVYAHPQVSLTIYNADELQTLQLQGTAEVETDLQMRKTVFANIAQPRHYGDDKRLPPVVQLKGQDFIVLRITITSSKFTKFKELP